jgi:hypothetical protein
MGEGGEGLTKAYPSEPMNKVRRGPRTLQTAPAKRPPMANVPYNTPLAVSLRAMSCYDVEQEEGQHAGGSTSRRAVRGGRT